MEQRRINGRTQVVARCEGAQARGIQTRPVAYETSRPVARRSTAQYVERAPPRSKTRSALMIAGSAAAGGGGGGALQGDGGPRSGGAGGGGSASLDEAA